MYQNLGIKIHAFLLRNKCLNESNTFSITCLNILPGISSPGLHFIYICGELDLRPESLFKATEYLKFPAVEEDLFSEITSLMQNVNVRRKTECAWGLHKYQYNAGMVQHYFLSTSRLILLFIFDISPILYDIVS